MQETVDVFGEVGNVEELHLLIGGDVEMEGEDGLSADTLELLWTGWCLEDFNLTLRTRDWCWE